jgi:Domain of unknown function (DUF2828)
MANGTRRARKPYTRKNVVKNVYNIDSQETSSLVGAITGKTPSTGMTLTENGARTLKSSGDAVLNLFSLGGALRSRSAEDRVSLFTKAYREDADLAMKALFYFRDIRGGQGERDTFRIIANAMASGNNRSILKNVPYIPTFGRWDDLFTFVGTPYEKEAFSYLKAQLDEDVRIYKNKEGHLSLLAKWLPSENTSSKTTRALATKFRQYLGWTPREYRTTLADLRGALKIVEREMSAGRWTGIDYEHIPSRASMIYRKAFGRHDQDGYAAYLASVEKGEKTIHAATLYPYDIVEKVLNGEGDATLNAQWKALPDYTSGGNALVVADVSGSMAGRPLASSVGLALYFAERNKGIFHNYFMTFTGQPELVEVKGTTLTQKIHNISKARWQQNTNVQAVFDLILSRAVGSGIPEEDMPKKIFIVSDMEFDEADYGNKRTNFEAIKAKYKKAGYEMPTLIFWNVDARSNQSPVKFDERGVMLVSGQSPSIFKSVMESKVVTPYDLMLEVLTGVRYEQIKA